MRFLLLALRFVLELCLLVSAGVVGFLAFQSLPAQVLAAMALMLLTGAVWGLLLAPKRRFDLPLAARVCIELALFGGAAAGLAHAGHPIWGVSLLVGEIFVVSALALLGMPPGSVVQDLRNPG
jgi:hypothetical protein